MVQAGAGVEAEATLAYEEATIISVCELLAFVVGATIQAPLWAGREAFYAGDNTNAISWLSSRYANNLLARHLLRLVTRLEIQFGCGWQGRTFAPTETF